jgi:serine/threonine protein kinase/cephalosporin-C deacetylase-like acetyl esterase
MEELPPGTTLAGKYKIIKVIGQGGMGVVYRAEDIKLNRSVALKFLPQELIQDEEASERFVLEARAAAALSHPNICTIHEIDEQEGKSFISMEYVEGQSLKERIDRGSLRAEEALNITIQIAEGLEEAHKKGIIHRDIKCANIMITEKGQAKILDFGLAKVKGGTLLTREGTTLGTVAYMSPEQAKGQEVDYRSDIWSLGVVMYEMLSGQLPFQGDREASILYSVVHEEPKSLKAMKRGLPPELQQIINRALKKNPGSRYSSVADMLKDLRKYQDVLQAEELGTFNLRTLLRRIRKPQIAIPAVAVVLSITLIAVWFLIRQANIRWAREEALPEIERLIEANWQDFTEPYKLAEQAENFIPNDPKLAELFTMCSLNINIKTEPPGADVYMKEYDSPESEWNFLGVSPIDKRRLPIGIFRWKIEKEGYVTVLAASSSWDGALHKKNPIIPCDLMRVLDKKGRIPQGMVRVQGALTPLGKLGDFYIDRYEVTNKQYKEFINSGGYRNEEYWEHEFIKDGRILTWEEAMDEFVDQTGRPGPATWQAGVHPEGQADYPVTGVSWFEAAAFAKFSGKSLPTGQHWGLARGEYTTLIRYPQMGGYAIFAPFSNFKGEGPVPVGSLQGITSYGAYDMAGNVREWCWNETSGGKLIRGGAWNDNPYRFTELAGAPPFDRSSHNGFRCALYPDPEKIPESAFAMTTWGEAVDFYKEKPVSDAIYQVYKGQFLYDKTELNEHLEKRDESSEDWIYERIAFDAAYGNERLIANLFLPKDTPSPYQTVIYFPGVASMFQSSSEGLEDYYEFPVFLSFLVKNGRAVLYPVYKGTFERRDDSLIPIHVGNNSHAYTQYLIKLVKDFKRSFDYLETRQDIDTHRIAYYGMSWGGILGAIIPAVEERLQTAIILGGGFTGLGRPEANQINYVTRVKMPFLMLHGKYDTIFPCETVIKPMFDLLGTQETHKELKLYETDHIPPRTEFIKEILAWLDRHLGAVNR